MSLKILKCESAIGDFPQGEGPSRGIRRDCENFADLRSQFYCVPQPTHSSKHTNNLHTSGQRKAIQISYFIFRRKVEAGG